MAKGLESLIPQGKTAVPKTKSKAANKNAADVDNETSYPKEKAEKPESKTKNPGKGDVISKENKAGGSSKAAVPTPEPTGAPVELRISQVVPNKNQPRAEFDEDALSELTESVRQYGIIQPLLVQKTGRYYEIIAGERRWRAAKRAGLKKVPAIIREYSSQEVVEIALIENIQREDLNAIEEARAYRRLLEEFDLKQEEVAQRVSKSRSAVTNSMRLLNLDERVQEMLISNEISAGHARALLALEHPDVQYTAAREIASRHLNVRETEKLVRKLLKPRAEKEKSPVDIQMESAYHAVEEQLTERMGTKVKINRGRGQRGRIEIEYYSQDDLNRIIDLIR